MSNVFRLYDPASVGQDGYPPEWHTSVKHLVRELAGHRCERCGHPYRVGESKPDWSPCDARCVHRGPIRVDGGDSFNGKPSEYDGVEASWRVLTVHHLNGVKWDLRWWNLAALCQRCHLTIQGKVRMERVYPFEHSAWFKIHAAGWYAAAYEGRDITREEAAERLDELLALEQMA